MAECCPHASMRESSTTCLRSPTVSVMHNTLPLSGTRTCHTKPPCAPQNSARSSQTRRQGLVPQNRKNRVFRRRLHGRRGRGVCDGNHRPPLAIQLGLLTPFSLLSDLASGNHVRNLPHLRHFMGLVVVFRRAGGAAAVSYKITTSRSNFGRAAEVDH